MTQIKLGDQIVDLSGQLPTVGSQAPDFLLADNELVNICLLYTSPSPRDGLLSRMPSSA